MDGDHGQNVKDNFPPVNLKFDSGDAAMLLRALTETMEVPVAFTREILALLSGALPDDTWVPSADIS